MWSSGIEMLDYVFKLNGIAVFPAARAVREVNPVLSADFSPVQHLGRPAIGRAQDVLHDAVAPSVRGQLGHVHGGRRGADIGHADAASDADDLDVLRKLALVVRLDYTDAPVLLPADVDSDALHVHAYPFGNLERGPVRDAVQEDAEFLPAQPANRIVRTDRRLQNLGDLPQDLIAYRMGVLVVDAFEIVKVDEHEVQVPALLPDELPDALLQVDFEVEPARQVRNRVEPVDELKGYAPCNRRAL